MAPTRTKQTNFPLLVTVYETARTAEATLNALLAPISLSLPQWSILHDIDDHPGITGAAIARHGGVSPAAVTTMLQRLEAMGLISRRAPAHGRVVETYLTPAGHERLQAGDALVNVVEQRLCAIPAEGELAMILTTMQHCITALHGLARGDSEERAGA